MEKTTQRERDIALYNHWQQQLLISERAVEVAKRQIAYIGQLLVQDSLEDLDTAWAEKRDAEFNH